MTVGSFLNTIYNGIDQKLGTMLLGQSAVIEFINYGLSEIYTHDGKFWSFMYKTEDIDLSAVSTENYQFQTSVPILRIIEVYDNKFGSVKQPKFLSTDRTLAQYEFFFRNMTNTVKVFNNDSAGYKLHYFGYFNKVTGINDIIPLPHAFEGALFNLVLSYIYPKYGQYGENKESNVYQRARQQLIELSKLDSQQVNFITSKIS